METEAIKRSFLYIGRQWKGRHEDEVQESLTDGYWEEVLRRESFSWKGNVRKREILNEEKGVVIFPL